MYLQIQILLYCFCAVTENLFNDFNVSHLWQQENITQSICNIRALKEVICDAWYRGILCS